MADFGVLLIGVGMIGIAFGYILKCLTISAFYGETYKIVKAISKVISESIEATAKPDILWKSKTDKHA